MTRDSHVTTFGPRWNNPSDMTHQLRDPFDLETGFPHDGCKCDTNGSFVNHASCHRVITPNGTPPSTVVCGGLVAVRQERKWVQHDPSPTSVQNDLVFTNTLPKVVTLGVSYPFKPHFFPLDTIDALVLRTHVDTFATHLSWNGHHLIDNHQSLHDDECWIRLEEGLHFWGRQSSPTVAPWVELHHHCGCEATRCHGARHDRM